MAITDQEDAIQKEWLEEFEAAARRRLELRMHYAFIHTYKPMLTTLLTGHSIQWKSIVVGAMRICRNG